MGLCVNTSVTRDRRVHVVAHRETSCNPLDAPDLARPPRPCSCCKREFQPSVRRRMLCAACYRNAPRLYAEDATLEGS